MFLVYAVSAIVAGVLVVLSLFGADHGGGHDADGDLDLDLHHDLGNHDVSTGPWLPFLSLRFWTYFFAGFGANGLLVSWLTATTAPLVIGLSLVVGLLCGFGVSYALRTLRSTESTSGAKAGDLLGKEGEVQVTIRGATPGRIRVNVRGDIIDYLATTEEPEPIEPGSSVVVLGLTGDRVLVARLENVLGDPTVQQGLPS